MTLNDLERQFTALKLMSWQSSSLVDYEGYDVYMCRNARGQGALRELLNPLVSTVVEDTSLQINTNPVEVYKQWVNQTEADSGLTRSASSVCCPRSLCALENKIRILVFWF